jgi:RHS repeat-associated protein
MFFSAASNLMNQFTSKERDVETGLDYFGARYYSGAQGRFTAPDPLLNSGRPDRPQSWNRYSYVLNNPLRYTDPTGLFEWDETLGGDLDDDELRKQAGTDRALRNRANNIIDQRNRIRDQLKLLAESDDPSLQQAAFGINAENVNNGVTISMGPVSSGHSAEESHNMPLRIDGNGNPLIKIQVLPGAGGRSLFLDLAHEGTHAADAQSFAWATNSTPVWGIEAELNAYRASIAAGRERGMHNVGPAGSPPFWSSSWSKVDQQTRPTQEILKFLLTSPNYSNDDNFSPAFTK